MKRRRRPGFAQPAADDATEVVIALASKSSTARPARGDLAELRDRAAMQIVGKRPPVEVRAYLDDADNELRRTDPEFGLLLVHELVVRGEAAPNTAQWYADWATTTSHALMNLPARLLPCEVGLPGWLPNYADNGSSVAGLGPPDEQAGARAGDLLPPLGREAAVDSDLILAPFRGWLGASNGRADVRAFSRGTGSESPPPEPRPAPDGHAAPITPAGALELLFSSCVEGGAYSGGAGGAYSRLFAWEAVAGLIDTSWPRDLESLASAAENAGWIRLTPSNPWFDGVAWDVWLAVVTRERVCLLAATDTD